MPVQWTVRHGGDMKTVLKAISLGICCAWLFAPIAGFAEIAPNKRCDRLYPTYAECWSCNNLSGCDDYKPASCSGFLGQAGVGDKKLMGPTSAGEVCTSSGYWCDLNDNITIDVPSSTVEGGYCLMTNANDCISFDLSKPNADGTCGCLQLRDCTVPQYCRNGYVMEGGTCIKCPFVNGVNDPRGIFEYEWDDITGCFAETGTTYTDSNGNFEFTNRCYYTR